MPYICNGCTSSFTSHGAFIRHLQQSTLGACQLARQQHEDSMRHPTRRDSHRRAARSRSQSRCSGHNTSPAPEASNEDVPVPFEGDFFGASAEYAGEDLPFDDNGVAADTATCQPAHDPELDEDSDAEDEAVGEDLTEPRLRTSVGGGELPCHSPAIPRDPSPMDVDDNRGSESLTPDVHGLSSAPSAAPGGIDVDAHIQLRQSPAYVIPFGGQAGMPCTPPLAGQPTRSGYEAYAHQVDPKDTNLYAPFTSRLDWEIAQWAKLRGPGSTAFSDLLAIEEVSLWCSL